MPVPTDEDYSKIAAALANGDVVPFLGAGASAGTFPSAGALAELLANAGKFPEAEGRQQLALVASYLVQVNGDTLELNRILREALDIEIGDRLGGIHDCLAGLDKVRLIVTTNYDDLAEQALRSRQPWIVVDRGTAGVVWYRGLDSDWQEIESENLSKAVDRSRPIVLKIHGSLDRKDNEHDSFLITEEQYVDFLGRPEKSQLPPMLAQIMKKKAFLFLGYGLKDWNIRVMLRKLSLARNSADRIRSWAVMRPPGEAMIKLLRTQNIEVLEVELATFVDELQKRLSP